VVFELPVTVLIVYTVVSACHDYLVYLFFHDLLLYQCVKFHCRELDLYRRLWSVYSQTAVDAPDIDRHMEGLSDKEFL